jgi:hypothetical protein
LVRHVGLCAILPFNEGHWVAIEIIVFILATIGVILSFHLYFGRLSLRNWCGLSLLGLVLKLVLTDFALLDIVIVLHHLSQRQDLLSNLSRVILFVVFLALNGQGMRFFELFHVLREEEVFVFVEDVSAHIYLVDLGWRRFRGYGTSIDHLGRPRVLSGLNDSELRLFVYRRQIFS